MNSANFKIAILFLIFAVVVSLSTFSLLKTTNNSGSMSRDEVEKIIAEYIANNPEVILESVNKHHQENADAEEQKAKGAAMEKRSELENDKRSPFVGNPQGDVVIAEFFDYACGYCKKVMPSVVKLLEEDKNVKIVFKEFPILSPGSELAARAALAVHVINPDKYLQFHTEAMKTRIAGIETIEKILSDIGVDSAKIKDKMNSEEITKILSDNKKLASEIGLRGTPAFTINGNLVPGAVEYETLKQMVAMAREK